ncbi:MAG TPA: hypothetical protein VMU10_12165 [Desulfomonilia bacterium]|nr:hypothetical protein [Desulfomonilia bacterium]
MILVKSKIIMLVGLCIFSLSANASGQSAREAVDNLKKLQSKCESGITYNEFMRVLTPAEEPARQYLQSPDANRTPEFSQTLTSLINTYEFARSVWMVEYPKVGVELFIVSAEHPEIYNEIIKTYPDVKVHRIDNGAENVPCVFIDEVIPKIWPKTSLEMQKLSDLLVEVEKPHEETKAPEKVEMAQSEDAPGETPVEEKAPVPEQPGDPVDFLKQQNDALKNELEKLKQENSELKKQLETLKVKPKVK